MSTGEAPGIPAIAGYPLPRAAEIPAPKVAWTPDAARAALLVHDMQGYFVAPFGGAGEPIVPVTANIARLLEAARARGVPVFYTAQAGDQLPRDRGLQADFWGPGLRAAPGHEAIVPPLVPGPGDVRLVKHRYSAFQRSDLAEQLRARGRDQLLICGVYAHIGCLLTAAEAFQRDIEPFLVADAVAAFSRRTHDLALSYVAGCCGVALATGEALRALAAGGPSLERMRADVAAMLGEPVGDIGPDDDLRDLGLDSMRAMTLLARWNAEAGVALEFADIAGDTTLAGWWRIIEARRRPPAAR